MKLLRLVLALTACILSLFRAGANPVNDYTFTHLGIEDGVAGPHIFTICQTPDGVVWWSTKNTVDRFNGSTIRSYVLDGNAPYSHFAGRTIGLVLSCDGKEELYAYDNKGRIFRYTPLQDEFSPVADIQALMGGKPVIMNHIHVDEDGIWVALDSGTFCLSGNTLVPVLDRRATHYILRVGEHEHLLCSESGVFRLSGPHDRAQFFFPCNAETAYYDPGTGRIWLGTFSSGIQVLEGMGGSVRALSVENLPANPVRSIIAKDPQTVLVGVDGFGVYSVPSQAAAPKASLEIHANDGAQGVLHGNGVYSLLKDKWDDIFIGTYSGGVDIARPTGGIARVYRHEPNRLGTVNNNHINCVAYDPSWGGPILGTDDGISYYRKGQSVSGAAGLVVLDILPQGDALLLATFGKGVFRLNKNGTLTQLYSKAGGVLRDDYVYSLLRGADGHLWMGSLMGDLVECTPEGFRYYPVSLVQDIAQLPDGRIAVGTAAGIKLVTPGNPVVEDLPYGPENEDVNYYVMSLYVDDNMLWIASDGGGVYVQDLDSGFCRQFTVRDGLPGNGVCSIVKGADGYFWVGTENGLCRMSTDGTVTPVNHIWMLNREYTRGATLLLPDGNILLGSTDGAVVLSPDKVEDISYTAPLRLIGAQFHAASEQERFRKMEQLQGEHPELKLRHRDNSFELHFESVNQRFQRDIAYQYSMDGGPWSRLLDDGLLRFIQVKSGTHNLRVRSVSRASRSVLGQQELTIRVAQPLWNTWWMWILYVILISSAFVGAWSMYQLHGKYLRQILLSPTLQASQLPSAPVEPEEAPENQTNKEFVDRCTRIVAEHMADSAFSIEDLCREMGLSRTYLYVRLKTFTGESPQDFIRFIRMEKAAALLSAGEPVADVSEAVGFDNPKYFSTVFKKYFGVSPSKYR